MNENGGFERLRRVLIGPPDDEIVRCEARMRAAQLAGDVAALDELIAEPLLFTGPDGQVTTREQDLAAHRAGVVRFLAHEPEELRIVRAGPDTAVAALRARLEVSVHGSIVAGTYRYTRVWVRDAAGRWRVTGGHVGEIRDAGAPAVAGRVAGTPGTADIGFEGVTPILRVESADASVRYYTERLGFALQWRDGDFACVARGDVSVFLSQGAQGRPGTWVYVGVADADRLHDELRARGATIRHPPTNYPWGARELHVFDPDRHVLRFGSGVPPGAPLGEWLDENGRRWLPQPDGSWREVVG